MKVVLQTSESDCLIACATMLMDSYGIKVPVYRLAEKIELSRAGSNVLQLKEALKEYGFGVEGFRVEELENSMLPGIAYVNNNHFIVVTKVTKTKVMGIDPAIGRISYEKEEFYKIYSKVLVKLNQIEKTFIPKDSISILSRFKSSKVLAIMLGLMLTAVATQIVAMSYSYLYNELIYGTSSTKVLSVLLLAIGILCVGSIAQGILTNRFNIIFEQIYGNNLLNQMVAKNYKFFTFRSNGDLLYRINARGAIKDSTLIRMIPSLIALCTIILVQWIVFSKSLLVGFVFTIMIFVYLLLYILIGAKIYSASNKYTQKIIKLNTTSENIVRAILTIKVLGVEDSFTKMWHKENEIQTKEYGVLVILQSIQNVLTNIFMYIVPIATITISIIISGNKDFVSQIALIPLLYLVIQNVTTIGQALNSIYQVLPVIDKTNELLDEKYMQDRPRQYATSSDSLISIKDMSYFYGSKCCLSDVNLEIKEGKKYAVIGKSGSGKSTFLKIVSNLLCDYNGQVLFNDSIKDKPIYMDQDTTILDASIMENIIFGQKDISQIRIDEVVKAIGLDKIVEAQPLKWFTNISKGKNLSRGQEQRICLTRCLLKDSSMYLLDEATSNIDVVDEEQIIKNLLAPGGLLEEKTVFVSTHKLSMVEYVDEVLYIQDGHIYKGSHEELLAKFAEYREMFEV